VGVALGFDSIWTADYNGGTVTRIDPENGHKEAVITLGGNPLFLAVTEDAVWVTDDGRGVVMRINPETHVVEETISVSFGPVGVANSPEGVWVALSDINQVVLIDPATNRVAERLYTASGPVNISIYEDQLWVASPSSGRVQRFDLASREKVADFNVGGEPTDVVADGRYAWVARSAADDVVRISLADNILVGDPLPTGDLPKTIVSDMRGGIWVMEEGARNVSHIVPTSIAPTAPEESLEEWLVSWPSVTLRTTALMATFGSPLYLLAGMLGLSAALAIRFYLEARSDNAVPTLWTIASAAFLGLPLLGAFRDVAIALAATSAALIAYMMVARLSNPALTGLEGLTGVEDGAEPGAA
jgi:streptogramin lyase